MNPDESETYFQSDDAINERHRKLMQRRKESYELRKANAKDEKGLLIVNTGSGKGKTTAGLGMIFRALGHGFKIAVVQFTKGAIQTGEAEFAKEICDRMDFFTLGEGYTWETQSRVRDMEVAREAWRKACDLLADPQYHMILLDELNIILKREYLPLDEVLETLAMKRPNLHVVVTGRGAPERLIDLADLVTEMKLVKHPYQSGVKAQKGVEF